MLRLGIETTEMDEAGAELVRIHDAPWQAGRVCEVLAVDDIADAPGRHTENAAHSRDVGAAWDIRDLANDCVKPAAERAADQSAVYRDAAGVHGDYVPRIVGEVAEMLEDV